MIGFFQNLKSALQRIVTAASAPASVAPKTLSPQEIVKELERRKEKLFIKVNNQIIDLNEIRQELINNQYFSYALKIDKIKATSESFLRILSHLKISKPYSKEIIKTIKVQALAVEKMIKELTKK